MFSGIVYKQWYCSVKDHETRSKNMAHLIYIATRQGTVFNDGCQFGLWGKLQGQESIGNINDFTLAQTRVSEMGKDNKTVYRAIISLDDESAIEKGFYNRESWQKLLTDKMSAIAKEKNMNISDSSFEWVASYHNERGHPHCHIMFWDNSDKVRNEFVSPKRMEIMSENIRAEFNSEIFRDELTNLREDSDYAKYIIANELKKPLSILDKALLFNSEDFSTDPFVHNLLCGAMLDVNPKECFNTKLGTEYLTELALYIDKATIMLPTTGSLKYSYLSKYAKKAIDDIVDKLLENSNYKALQSKYIEINSKISELHGNSAESIKHNEEKANNKLKASLGNSVLKTLKNPTLDIQKGINYFSDLENYMLNSILNIDKGNSLYDELEKRFTGFRLPTSQIMDKDDWKNLNNLIIECIGSDKSDDYINLFFKLYTKENFNSKFADETISKFEQYKSMREGYKALLIVPSAEYPEAFNHYKKNKSKIETQYKKSTAQMMGSIMAPLKDELLESIKRQKGWYDFSDKIAHVATSDELKPYLDETKNQMFSRIHELINTSNHMKNCVSKLISSMPKRMQPYDTFYNDGFSKNMRIVMNLLSNDEAINNQIYNYIDCLQKEKTFLNSDEALNEKAERKLMFSQIFKDIHNEVISHCVEEKGWNKLYKQDMALKLATIVFGEISQTLGQERSNLKNMRVSKDMSKSQKKELSRKLASANADWGEEM